MQKLRYWIYFQNLNIFSALFSSPILYFYYTDQIPNYGTQCWITFSEQWQWQIYMTIVSMTRCVIPAILIAACYIIIVCTIWNKGKEMSVSFSNSRGSFKMFLSVPKFTLKWTECLHLRLYLSTFSSSCWRICDIKVFLKGRFRLDTFWQWMFACCEKIEIFLFLCWRSPLHKMQTSESSVTKLLRLIHTSCFWCCGVQQTVLLMQREIKNPISALTQSSTGESADHYSKCEWALNQNIQ